jgi:hypothetical protein
MDNMPYWLATIVSKAHPKIAEAAILDYKAAQEWRRMDGIHARAWDKYGARVFKAKLRGQEVPAYVTKAWEGHLKRHEAMQLQVAKLWAHAEEEHDKAVLEVHGKLPPLHDSGGELLRFKCTTAGPCAWHREHGRPERSWE